VVRWPFASIDVRLEAGRWTGYSDDTSTAIAQFLFQRGFEDVKTEDVMAGMRVVRAHKGECHLFVVELATSKGWTQDLIRTLTDASDELFIVSRGFVYDYDSTWLAVSDDIYFRTLRKIGLARAAAVLGVAATPICVARRLPWNRL
jgi:hypothetical protein